MRPHTRTQCQVGGNCQECLPASNNLEAQHHSSHQQPFLGGNLKQNGSSHHYSANGVSSSEGFASQTTSSHPSHPNSNHHNVSLGVSGHLKSTTASNLSTLIQSQSLNSSVNSALLTGCSPSGGHAVTSTSHQSPLMTSSPLGSSQSPSTNDNALFAVPTITTMTRSRSSSHVVQRKQQKQQRSGNMCEDGENTTAPVSSSNICGPSFKRTLSTLTYPAPPSETSSYGSRKNNNYSMECMNSSSSVCPLTSENTFSIGSSLTMNMGSCAGSVNRTPILVELPAEILVKILTYLSFGEIAQLRIVSRRFNEICASILNVTFHKLQSHILQWFQDIKQRMPRRESARRNHPLAQECDIVETLHMKLTLLQMTFGRHIERKHMCFFPGEILDEIYRIMWYIKSTSNMIRAYKVTDELVDLSTMAMEYFKERIDSTLPDITCFGAEYLNFTTPYSSSSPSKRRSVSGSASSSLSSSSSLASSTLIGGGGGGGVNSNTASNATLSGISRNGNWNSGTLGLDSSSSNCGGVMNFYNGFNNNNSNNNSGILDDDDDITVFEDEELMAATDMLKAEIRKIKMGMKKSSVLTIGLKKQMKTVKVKVESQSKQYTTLSQRLDAYDKKMEEHGARFQTVLAELNKCKTELQFWRSRHNHQHQGNTSNDHNNHHHRRDLPSDGGNQAVTANNNQQQQVSNHTNGSSSSSNGGVPPCGSSLRSSGPTGIIRRDSSSTIGNGGGGVGSSNSNGGGPLGVVSFSGVDQIVELDLHENQSSSTSSSHSNTDETSSAATSTYNVTPSIGVTLRARKNSGEANIRTFHSKRANNILSGGENGVSHSETSGSNTFNHQGHDGVHAPSSRKRRHATEPLDGGGSSFHHDSNGGGSFGANGASSNGGAVSGCYVGGSSSNHGEGGHHNHHVTGNGGWNNGHPHQMAANTRSATAKRPKVSSSTSSSCVITRNNSQHANE